MQIRTIIYTFAIDKKGKAIINICQGENMNDYKNILMSAAIGDIARLFVDAMSVENICLPRVFWEKLV